MGEVVTQYLWRRTQLTAMARLARVLLINYEYPPLGAGAGNATAHIARALARAGTRTLVLTTRWRGLPARASEDGVEVVRVPAWRRRVDRASPLEMLSYLGGAAGAACLVPPCAPLRLSLV